MRKAVPGRFGKAKILLVTWTLTTALVTWWAILPTDLPGQNGGVAGNGSTVDWFYPAGVAIVGAIAAAALKPWRRGHSVPGAAIAYVVIAAFAACLAVTATHAPPVHRNTAVLALVLAHMALFYGVYAFATRKRTRAPLR